MALMKASFMILSRPEEYEKISTPNQIAGTVVERTDGGVNSEMAV